MTSSGKFILLGSVRFDPEKMELADAEGERVPLRPQSAEVLLELARHASDIVSKDRLIEAVWSDINVTDESLTQCIADIRRAIGDKSHRIVQTVPKKGYRLVPKASVKSSTVAGHVRHKSIGLAVLLALIAGAAVWFSRPHLRGETNPGAEVTAAATGVGIAVTAEDSLLMNTPAIAVLAFESLSGSERWTRIGKGIAADIANELARNKELYVTAPETALQIAAESMEARSELNVRFILDGTIQAEEGTLRIMARLTDTTTRTIVWSERWTREASDLFAVQDEIVTQIGAMLGSTWWGVLASAERAIAHRRPTESLASYELTLLAVEQKHKFTQESYAKAATYLERALAIDPDNVRALALLSNVEILQADIAETTEAAARLWEKSFAHGRLAHEIDPSDPQALLRIATEAKLTNHLAEAYDAVSRAIAVSPNDADVLALASVIYPFKGEDGRNPFDWARRAIELSPRHPDWYFMSLGHAAFFAGEIETAAAALRRGPRDMPDTFVILGPAEALLGRMKEAEIEAARFHALDSYATLSEFFGTDIDGNPLYGRLAEGARLAGIPVSERDLHDTQVGDHSPAKAAAAE